MNNAISTDNGFIAECVGCDEFLVCWRFKCVRRKIYLEIEKCVVCMDITEIPECVLNIRNKSQEEPDPWVGSSMTCYRC